MTTGEAPLHFLGGASQGLGAGKTTRHHLWKVPRCPSLSQSLSHPRASALQVLQAYLGLICMSERPGVPHRVQPVRITIACQPEGLHTQLLLSLAPAPSGVLSPWALLLPWVCHSGSSCKGGVLGMLRQSSPGPLGFGSCTCPLLPGLRQAASVKCGQDFSLGTRSIRKP